MVKLMAADCAAARAAKAPTRIDLTNMVDGMDRAIEKCVGDLALEGRCFEERVDVWRRNEGGGAQGCHGGVEC